jgi:hypothetical protein
MGQGGEVRGHQGGLNRRHHPITILSDAADATRRPCRGPLAPSGSGLCVRICGAPIGPRTVGRHAQRRLLGPDTSHRKCTGSTSLCPLSARRLLLPARPRSLAGLSTTDLQCLVGAGVPPNRFKDFWRDWCRAAVVCSGSQTSDVRAARSRSPAEDRGKYHCRPDRASVRPSFARALDPSLRRMDQRQLRPVP